MSLYVCMIFLIELTMVTMIIHVANYSGFSKEERTWYLVVFSVIVVCAAAECFAIVFNAKGSEYALPLTIITVIQFSLTPLLPVFFAGALGMHREAKIVGAFFLVNVLAEIISAPFGWIFYFDEAGRYVRGQAYIIYELSYVISLIFLIVSLFVVGRRFRKRDICTIMMVLVVMISSIIPMVFFKVYSDYLGIALCACLCYIYYNDLIQEDMTAELLENQKRITVMQERIISGLANLIESRDTETGEHVARTSNYVKMLAENARRDGVYADDLDDVYISLLYRLAPMHDIGKIVVSDGILKKPGRLTESEFEQMKKHASEGGSVVREVLSGITEEQYIAFASDIATYHHERWDGKGYPSGLSGEEIPLAARIMAIADVYDALISERCYKKPMPREKALEIIREEAGTHFDPKLAEVFLNHIDDFK